MCWSSLEACILEVTAESLTLQSFDAVVERPKTKYD